MATIDEDNDIYNGGGGGGGSIDPDSIPDDTNIFLGTNNWCDANGVPEKAWFQQPIAMKMASSGANRIWTLALRKYYDFGAVNQPPALIHGSNSQTKSKYFSLNFESYFNNQNHQASRGFLLLDLNLLVNSDDGKFLKLVKVSGGYWDFALETPSSTPEIFEVYIDKNDSANNKNVSYSDIVNAINSDKLVYLKILYTDNSVKNFYVEKYDPIAKRIFFTCVHPLSQWEGYYTFESQSVYINDSNQINEWNYNILNFYCEIDESITPAYKKNIDFHFLFNAFIDQPENDIILYYTNSSGDRYKLRAIKLTATEIMFSVYDPDTARNLSIVVNDQDQYTVIT